MRIEKNSNHRKNSKQMLQTTLKITSLIENLLASLIYGLQALEFSTAYKLNRRLKIEHNAIAFGIQRKTD